MLDRIREYIKKGDTVPKFLDLAKNHQFKTEAGFKLLVKACAITEHEFIADFRRTGHPVQTHLLGTASILIYSSSDENLVIAGVLHDLLEDKPHWDYQSLEREFNTDVANLVYSVTKRKRCRDEDYHQFEKMVSRNVRAGGKRAVKLKGADRIHNIITPWGTRQSRLNKVLETLRYVLPLTVDFDVLWKELTFVCATEISKINKLPT